MAHLRMHQSMQQATFIHCAALDTGAHREIDKIRRALGRSPTRSGSRGRIDIGVKPTCTCNAPHLAGKIVILPSGFRGGSDESVGIRPSLKVDRGERSDSDGARRISGPFSKKLARFPLSPPATLSAGGDQQALWAIAKATNKFCSPASIPPKIIPASVIIKR